MSVAKHAALPSPSPQAADTTSRRPWRATSESSAHRPHSRTASRFGTIGRLDPAEQAPPRGECRRSLGAGETAEERNLIASVFWLVEAKEQGTFPGKVPLRCDLRVWYTYIMSIEFGTGVPLNQTRPELRDPQTRVEIILDVVERNSVIEGLPPFTELTREKVRRRLLAISDPEVRHE
jgi:hypothetical protein